LRQTSVYKMWLEAARLLLCPTRGGPKRVPPIGRHCTSNATRTTRPECASAQGVCPRPRRRPPRPGPSPGGPGTSGSPAQPGRERRRRGPVDQTRALSLSFRFTREKKENNFKHLPLASYNYKCDSAGAQRNPERGEESAKYEIHPTTNQKSGRDLGKSRGIAKEKRNHPWRLINNHKTHL